MRALGTTALVIGAGGLGTGFVKSMGLPYPALIDREREVYRAYGLTRAMLLLTESATFLIDREGIVRHATRSLNPRASMDWTSLMRDVQASAARAVDATKASDT